jgi:hypothetical protein
MKISTPSLLVIIAAAAHLLISCGDNNAPDAGNDPLTSVALQFVPQQAAEVAQAEGVPWVQLNFKLTGNPIEVLFSDSRMAWAKGEGWRICRPMAEADSQFEDRTVTPARQRSQMGAVFFRAGILVVVSALQTAPLVPANDANDSGHPAPFTQLMVIARNAEANEVEDTASSLGAKCE